MFPPVNRRDVTYRYPRGGGSFEFSLFSPLSFGFKYPVAMLFTLTFISAAIRCQSVVRF